VWLPLAVADSKGERPPSPFGLRMNFQLAAFPYKTHMVLDDAADTLSFAFFSKFLDPPLDAFWWRNSDSVLFWYLGEESCAVGGVLSGKNVGL